MTKAYERVKSALASGQFETHALGNPKESAKTVAFRGALADKDSPDAYKVSDIREAPLSTAGLPTGKSRRYRDASGRAFNFYPGYAQERAARRRADLQGRQEDRTAGQAGTPIFPGRRRCWPKATATSTRSTTTPPPRGHPVRSEPRGVNYADNVHAIQAADWGSQQMRRADVHVSHADQYPVVRDWASEGRPSLAPEWSSHFGEHAGMSLGPQWVKTQRQDHRGRDQVQAVSGDAGRVRVAAYSSP